VFQSSGGGEPAPKPQSSGDLESRSRQSSSAFYIDMPAMSWSVPLTAVEQKLLDLQAARSSGPFPDSPGRNYNVLACGFDLGTKKHVLRWPNASLQMIPKEELIVPVLKFFDRLVEQGHKSEFWSPGVYAIHAFLVSMRDQGMKVLRIFSNNEQFAVRRITNRSGTRSRGFHCVDTLLYLLPISGCLPPTTYYLRSTTCSLQPKTYYQTLTAYC